MIFLRNAIEAAADSARFAARDTGAFLKLDYARSRTALVNTIG
jgi:hypothetical protein